MSPLAVRAEAEAEMHEGYDWYEERGPGVGSRFFDQVDRIFEEIHSAPHRYSTVYRDVHMALVRHFPYAIFYGITPSAVVVYSVFHTSRNPDIWKSRIED